MFDELTNEIKKKLCHATHYTISSSGIGIINFFGRCRRVESKMLCRKGVQTNIRLFEQDKDD